MTVLKPRSRMISVRLSEDEYSSLQQLCEATGARSVSDLTRDAVRALMQSSAPPRMSSTDVEEFRAQIAKLNRKVDELSAQAGSPK
jgi:Arc/MetJ-type ribon-helix-helix transcriptional regulator